MRLSIGRLKMDTIIKSVLLSQRNTITKTSLKDYPIGGIEEYPVNVCCEDI